MVSFKKISSILLINLLFCTQVLAFASSTLPHGCEVTGFGFNQGRLVVNDTEQQSFYLIQNRIDKPIELQRIENREVFMSPSMIARLDADNWAALASDIQYLNFQCFIRNITPVNKEQASNDTNTQAQVNLVLIDCETVLDVCKYPRVKFALSNMGSYWVSTNKSQAEAIQEATRKGIYLRW